MKKLEIGPGKQKINPDWYTVNIVDTPATDYVCQWGEERLPFEDNTFDWVFGSHVLEHVPWYKTHDALKDVHRILKPGGIIEMHVPDFEIIVDCYLKRKPTGTWKNLNPGNHPFRSVAARIFRYGTDWHKAIFDERYLEECLRESGFQHIMKVSSTKHECSLGMTAVKP